MSPGVNCNTEKHYPHVLSFGQAPEIAKEENETGTVMLTLL